MSTLSSVTDGQLCDDSGVPTGAPIVIGQTSGSQAVLSTTNPVVSAQASGETVVPATQGEQVVNTQQAPQVLVQSQSRIVILTSATSRSVRT